MNAPTESSPASMPASGAAFAAPQVPAQAAAVDGSRAAVGSFSGRVISSAALLQGSDAVYIDHAGVLYQLRATRQGKLILTK